MALSTATVTMDLSDLLGVDFNARRTKVWVSTNVPNDTVIDTADNKIRLGSGNVTVSADGTASVVVWTPGAGSNPASWQTSIHVDYPDRQAHGGRGKRTFGPFTITASADLADLVDEQEVPAEYVTTLTAELDGYVTNAEAAAAVAQSAAELASAITGLDNADDAITVLDANPASDFRQQQDARLSATIGAVAATLQPRTIVKPEGLRRWAATYPNCRNQGGLANVLMLGDSTAWGVGADGTQQTTSDSAVVGKNSADQLRKRFNSDLGLAIDYGQVVLPSDSRVVGTATSGSPATGAFGTTSKRVDGATSQMVFPSLLATDIDFIGVWNPTVGGQFRYSIDGGGDVTPSADSAGSAVGKIYKRSVTGLSAGPAVHAPTIKAPTDTAKRYYMIGARYRSDRGVTVARVGKPGATTLDAIQGVSGSTTAAGIYRRQLLLTSINAWEPDLMILKLGINDLGLPGAGQAQAITPAQYKANLKQLCLYVTDPNAAAEAEYNGADEVPVFRTLGGSVLLVIGPHAATVGTTPEEAYWDAAREVCDEMDHVSLINLADWYGSFEEAHYPSMGLQLPGSVHSTEKGYARDADIIFRALTSPQVVGLGA